MFVIPANTFSLLFCARIIIWRMVVCTGLLKRQLVFCGASSGGNIFQAVTEYSMAMAISMTMVGIIRD